MILSNRNLLKCSSSNPVWRNVAKTGLKRFSGPLSFAVDTGFSYIDNKATNDRNTRDVIDYIPENGIRQVARSATTGALTAAGAAGGAVLGAPTLVGSVGVGAAGAVAGNMAGNALSNAVFGHIGSIAPERLESHKTLLYANSRNPNLSLQERDRAVRALEALDKGNWLDSGLGAVQAGDNFNLPFSYDENGNPMYGGPMMDYNYAQNFQNLFQGDKPLSVAEFHNAFRDRYGVGYDSQDRMDIYNRLQQNMDYENNHSFSSKLKNFDVSNLDSVKNLVTDGRVIGGAGGAAVGGLFGKLLMNKPILGSILGLAAGAGIGHMMHRSKNPYVKLTEQDTSYLNSMYPGNAPST